MHLDLLQLAKRLGLRVSVVFYGVGIDVLADSGGQFVPVGLDQAAHLQKGVGAHSYEGSEPNSAQLQPSAEGEYVARDLSHHQLADDKGGGGVVLLADSADDSRNYCLLLVHDDGGEPNHKGFE